MVALVQGKTGNTKNITRVLLIDDEEDNAELVSLNLENSTLKVTTTSTPSQALMLLTDQSFDCIVSDYKMPEMNGIQLCTEVRKKSNIPFIIYTSWESEKVARAALAAGVDYYTRKQETLAHYQNLARSIEYAVKNKRNI
jgi:CheY-like chemotaxis protein